MFVSRPNFIALPYFDNIFMFSTGIHLMVLKVSNSTSIRGLGGLVPNPTCQNAKIGKSFSELESLKERLTTQICKGNLLHVHDCMVFVDIMKFRVLLCIDLDAFDESLNISSTSIVKYIIFEIN